MRATFPLALAVLSSAVALGAFGATGRSQGTGLPARAEAVSNTASERIVRGQAPSRLAQELFPRAAARQQQYETEPRAAVGISTPKFSLFGFSASVEFGADAGAADSDVFPLASSGAAAPAVDQSQLCSSWAKFPVGSWARLRTTSVVFENGKSSQSVTETRVELKSVDQKKKRYVLQYDYAVRAGDVVYPNRSETIEYDFWDVPCDDRTKTETLAPVNLVIARRAVPCQTRRVVRVTENARETTVVWYSPVTVPCILQKETTREPLDQDARPSAVSRELFVVQSTSANSLLGIAPASYPALVSSSSPRRNATGSRVVAPGVPGGLASETSVEANPDGGAATCRTETTLLDYYIADVKN